MYNSSRAFLLAPLRPVGFSHRQAVESRLGQSSRQQRPLQPSLTVSHIENSDGTVRDLQPAAVAVFHRRLRVQHRVGQQWQVGFLLVAAVTDTDPEPLGLV